MNFGREKRLLLGATALLVALPLPLTDSLDWPSLVLFVAVTGAFLYRAASGTERWLSDRTLNILGLVYLPLLLLDLAAWARTQPVRPILHLILFGVAAKLWSLRREKDKWQAWIGIFFLFLAAMATSTHPSVIAYLLAFLGLSVVLLLRFVHLHVLATYTARRQGAIALGARGPLLVLALATILLAVPLFALLPRVRSPFVVGPGGLQSGPSDARMGYSDEMTLDRIGQMRNNPEVAVRIAFDGLHPNPQALRLRGAVFEEWEGRTWRPAPGHRLLRSVGPPTEPLTLVDGREVGTARLALEPLRSTHLILPVETVAIEPLATRITVSDGGAVMLPTVPERAIEYRVRLGPAPTSAALPPDALDAESAVLDVARVSPEMAQLAAEWAGVGTPEERAARIEQHFHVDFAYSLEDLGRGGERALEEFLLRSRRGHCEYFASAMVLLLRSQGIPARLVTGFYGAEWSRWEAGWVVRQSNAHAWVEAWIPGRGWTIYDPTPPAGRPSAAPTSLAATLRQAWEAAVYRWDRWVISYDFDDQVGALGSLRSWWSELLRRFGSETPTPQPAPGSADPSAPGGEAAPGEGPPTRSWRLVVGLVLLLALLGPLLFLRRRAWTVADAYRALREVVAAVGLPVVGSMAPLALERLIAQRLPTAAPAAGRVIRLYVREVYAGHAAAPADVAALREAVAEVERAARRHRRTRRRTARAARAA